MLRRDAHGLLGRILHCFNGHEFGIAHGRAILAAQHPKRQIRIAVHRGQDHIAVNRDVTYVKTYFLHTLILTNIRAIKQGEVYSIVIG